MNEASTRNRCPPRTKPVIIRCRVTYEQYMRLLDEAKLEEQSASELVRRGIDLVTKLRATAKSTAAA